MAASRPAIDEDRSTAGPAPDRPPARPDGARVRTSRLRPRGVGDRLRSVDPGPAGAARGAAREGQRVPQPVPRRRLGPAVDGGAVGPPARQAARAVRQPVPPDVPVRVPQLPAGARVDGPVQPAAARGGRTRDPPEQRGQPSRPRPPLAARRAAVARRHARPTEPGGSHPDAKRRHGKPGNRRPRTAASSSAPARRGS